MDKEIAKKMLFKAADVIERNNLMFFLTDGSCLGAYREHDFIDTDTDVDLRMLAEDLVPNFKLLISEFTLAGFRTQEGAYSLNFLNIMTLWLGSEHLEITSLFLIDGERWSLGKKGLVYPSYLFENPEQMEFLGRKFYVPTSITEYLERTYGPDYMTPIVDFTRPPGTLRHIDADIRAKMEAWHELR